MQLAVIGAILLVTLVWPLWLMVRGALRTSDGLGWTAHHVLDVFRDPLSRAGLMNALAIAACVTVGTLLLSMPLALVSSRLAFRGKALLSGLLLLPLILPPFVGAIGLRHLLGREGSLNALLLKVGLVDHGIDFVGAGGFWAVVLLLVSSIRIFQFVLLRSGGIYAGGGG